MKPLSILIVDDEMLAVRGIQDYIPWEELSIGEVGVAYSMKQAQAVFAQSTVDIMLCDIEMPGGSGLELLRWVHETHPDTVTLFLTCHSNFRYAQEAIALGATNYLLKPIPYDELQRALEQAVQKRREILENHTSRRRLSAILSDCLPEHEETEISKSKKLVTQVKAYIDENLHSELSRGQISHYFYLNPDYFARIFKREEGISLSDYICKRRMQYAKRLLVCTSEPISAICEKAGYTYNSHFSKIFKRETGLSPADYRKEHGA